MKMTSPNIVLERILSSTGGISSLIKGGLKPRVVWQKDILGKDLDKKVWAIVCEISFNSGVGYTAGESLLSLKSSQIKPFSSGLKLTYSNLDGRQTHYVLPTDKWNKEIIRFLKSNLIDDNQPVFERILGKQVFLTQVNRYLKKIGIAQATIKDFKRWKATYLLLQKLNEVTQSTGTPQEQIELIVAETLERIKTNMSKYTLGNNSQRLTGSYVLNNFIDTELVNSKLGI